VVDVVGDASTTLRQAARTGRPLLTRVRGLAEHQAEVAQAAAARAALDLGDRRRAGRLRGDRRRAGRLRGDRRRAGRLRGDRHRALGDDRRRASGPRPR
jgi:hypothetical protein